MSEHYRAICNGYTCAGHISKQHNWPSGYIMAENLPEGALYIIYDEQGSRKSVWSFSVAEDNWRELNWHQAPEAVAKALGSLHGDVAVPVESWEMLLTGDLTTEQVEELDTTL